MSYQQKWEIYCLTEGMWKDVWSVTAPTVCPTNPAHTVNLNSVTDIQDESVENAVSPSADGDFMTTIVATQLSNITIDLPSNSGELTNESNTQTLTNKTIIDSSNTVEASRLRTATGSVLISGSGAPSAGHVLIADGIGTATWGSIGGGGGTGDENSYPVTFRQYRSGSKSYKSAVCFIYSGNPTITRISFISWVTKDTYSIRVVDLTNGTKILEETYSNNKRDIQTTNNLFNIPNSPSIFELQIKKNGGGQAYVESLVLYFD